LSCAPGETAAYFASRFVLVPVKPEYLATIGLPLLARSLDEFQLENDDHTIEILGIVFNHSSSYSVGPEGNQAIKEVTAEARKRGWPVFNTHVRYSASYPKSAREGTAIGSTSYVRWDVTQEFTRFRTEFFEAIGLKKDS